MENLKKELATINSQQWTVLISLLTVVNIVVLGGLIWLLAVQSPGDFRRVLAQAPATRTPFPTFTPSPTNLPPPTPVSTYVPTWTPTITLTPTPTGTPTPVPTATPIRATSVPIPTNTPTPEYDYVGTLRQLTACENQGKHHIFAYVRDPAGNGLPGVNLRVFWLGGSGGEAVITTGTKVEDPGLTDFAMFKGEYYIEVMDGLSQVIGPISPDIPRNELCPDNDNTEANSLYHYSFEVIFTKVR
ncbi:MAG: hypothetical protein JXM69_03155 [Anaerolineae bacterium]|nr:hypothetical protein [Anaerolineae bacterium]